MERRYNILDVDDLSIAKEFMERRMKAARTAPKKASPKAASTKAKKTA
jgi:hypothetical protein